MNIFTQKFSYIFLSALLLFSCVPNKGGVKSNINSKISSPSTSQTMGSVSVSSVEVVNNQLVITGRNFDNIKKIKVEGPYLNENFTIESINSSRIVANAMKAISIGVNGVMGMQGVFNLIMSDANAAATFAVSFTLQDRSVTANKLSSMGAQVGQVLKYNGTTWVPANLSSSQLYLGTYNASTDQVVGSGAPISSIPANPGDYFIVAVAGVYNSVTYPVNSWIMFNGTSWELISNGESFVSSFKGRRGVVVPAKGDYTLGQMNDVTLTAPANNDVLTYESATSQWKAVQLPLRSVTASGPLVSSGGQTTDISFASTSQNFVLAGPASGSGVPAFRALGIGDLPVISSYVAGATAKTAIANTDSIPQALGKVQGYLNALDGDYVSKNVGTTSTVNGTVDFSALSSYLYVNTPTVAATDREAANVKYVKDYVATKGVWDQGTNIADVVRTTGNIGIGTVAPSTKLNIVDNISADEYQIQIDRFSGNVGTAPTPAGFRLNSARGTQGASAPAIVNDELGKIDFGSSESATVVTEGAVIKGIASGTWAAGQHPTDISFLTSPNSVSAPLERMRIFGNTGNVVIAGEVHASKYFGDGSALTGIGSAGGVSNVGSTSIAADTGATNAGNIAFSTSGVPRLTIQNASLNGLVSVGSNANPGGLFAVSGSGNTELFRVSNNATAINYADITGGSTNGLGPVFTASGAATDIGLQINSKGAGNLILNGNGVGNVGIGTTAPATMLEIGSSVANTNAILTFGKTVASTETNLPTISQVSSLVAGSGNDLNISANSTSGGLLFGTASTTRMTINSSGNVGIGTTVPYTLLQVHSSSSTSGIQYLGRFTGGASSASDWSDGVGIIIGAQGASTNHYNSRIISRSYSPGSYGSKLQLQTHDTSATAESWNTGILIDNLGNVGIGTTAPASTALLDMTSTAKGLLIPRMTTAQKTAIAPPATGLQVYDTDQKAINFYNGTVWEGILHGTVVGTSGGIPYYNGTSMASSAVLAANALVIGGGAGIAPSTLPAGTSGYVLTSAGASAPAWTQFVSVANGGTGAALTTATAGAMPYFNSATTMAVATAPVNLTQPNVLLSSGAGVPTWTNSTTGNFLKGSVAGVGFGAINSSDITSALATPTAIGNTTPSTGNFTTLSATRYSGIINSSDTRAVVDTPETSGLAGTLFDFKANATNGLNDGGTYNGVMTYRPYGGTSDWSGGPAHQMGFSANGNLFHRFGSSTTWGVWRRIIEENASGNVGVGWNAPNTKLDVNLAGTTTLTTIQQNVNANAVAISSTYGAGANYLPGFEWYTTDNAPTKPKAGVWAYADGSGSKMLFGTSNSYVTGITNTAMAIDSAGNVGIGTTAPNYALQVNSGYSTEPYLQGYFSSTMANGYGGVGVNGINQSHTRYFLNDVLKWQTRVGAGAGVDDYRIYSWTKGQDVLTVKNTGDVGIGTTAPSNKLDVLDTTSTNVPMIIRRGIQGADASMVTTFGTPYLRIGGVEYLNNSLQSIGFGYTSGGSNQPAEIGFKTITTSAYTSGDIVFANRNGTTNVAPAEVMRITSTGNVGVGTPTPGAKLEVAGNFTRDTVRYITETRSLTAAVGDWVSVGSFANNGVGNYGKITLYTHACGTIQMASYAFAHDAYSGGSSATWIELRPDGPNSLYGDTQTVAVDVYNPDRTLTSSPVQMRLRTKAAPCATMGITALIETNAAFTASTTSGAGGSVATGYLGSKQWMFPVSTGPWNATTEGLYVQSNGNVGIGTTAPATKLNAVGNIRNSAPSTGYLELSGDLPGYAINTYPTLKASGSYIYFSVAGAYSAYMGVGGVVTAVSDRNKKENFTSVDQDEIRAKIDSMPMMQWNYKGENSNIQHIAPIAQDFYNLFHLNGPNDKMISSIDPAGVAIVGLKAVSSKLRNYEEHIQINKEGNIGIGGLASSHPLQVNGVVAATTYVNASDERYKKDITKISNALEKLTSLDGVFYNWRADEFPDIKFGTRREMGVIAQKVEKVFPEAVTKDEKGFRSVAYSMLIAPIIEAVKELDKRIADLFKMSDKQSRAIASLQSENAQLKKENAAIKAYLCSKDPKAAICSN